MSYNKLDNYMNEVKFQVGERVVVGLKEIPKEERNCDTGTIITIYTIFANTPKMRKIMYHIRFDDMYVKPNKVMYCQIWEIRCFDNKITREGRDVG